MRTFKHIASILALVAGLSLTTQAGETAKKADAEAPKELKKQTHCPVMGGKIDSTVYTDIHGQRVYHCCPGCSENLKKDPAKYFKKAAAEGVLFENIQATCPVSGKELAEKTVYVDHEGRRVYFCCEACPDKFTADPAKYLKVLGGAIEESDHGHDHGDDHDQTH